ncbi:2,3,4,5-tetrahydropyridine-2,6-dicarboxylate N-acetyltransferase [Oenococcus sp.]|uniref:2,3,4,5-tetrahydropyridine-2,6-dicarboxylate N-acetyltransferase n=1 Tax=Oenococcus sp. TaxID=1979414 RepID=UPI0039E8FA28
MTELDAEKIISFIANAPKKTPVKVTYKGQLTGELPQDVKQFAGDGFGLLFGDWQDIKPLLSALDPQDYVVENDGRNTGVPMLDKKNINARIEPGAFIRDQVKIGDHAVIMMGAVINIGAEIGEGSMIDMGAVLGGRAIVGKHCHIGAGTVLAGVVEPASAQPVRVADNVLIGANAVVIEGVQIGEGAVVGAGAVVIKDVAPHTVVAGVPARVIKEIDAKTEQKTALVDALRQL